MKELSQQEAEAISEKWPLPDFDEGERFDATLTFVEGRKRGLAWAFVGEGNFTVLRAEWRTHMQEWIKTKRWRLWCAAAACKWDAQRGKYIAMNPEAKP